MKALILKLVLIILPLGITAQQFPSPSTSPANQYILQWSDEFNYNDDYTKNHSEQLTYIAQKWFWWGGPPCNDVFDYTNSSDNLEVSGGSLKMYITQKTTPVDRYKDCNIDSPLIKKIMFDACHLRTWNGIHQNNQMNFGYYEMRFKLPPGTDSINGQPRNRGVQFAWWQWGGNYNINSNEPHWMEVDFLEFSGHANTSTQNYLFGYRGEGYMDWLTGWKDYPPRYLNRINFNLINGNGKDDDGPHVPIAGLPSLKDYAGFVNYADPDFLPDSEGFHTLGCEVTPNKITWFLNGKFLQTTVGKDSVTETLPCLLPMNMEMALMSKEGFDANYSESVFDDTFSANNASILPYVVEIDYIRFYRFVSDENTDRFDIESPCLLVPISNMTDKVYKRIHIGCQSGPPRIISGDLVALRAKEYIQLNGGFEVEVGGDFFADVHNCDCSCTYALLPEETEIDCIIGGEGD